MILILGGTSELYPLSQELLENGLEVLVSTATDIHIDLPKAVQRRSGRLNTAGISDLCSTAGITLIIDAGHPFSYMLHAACIEASAQTRLPLLRFVRPLGNLPLDITQVSTHEKAAEIAFSYNGPVLLTIGSKSLAPYISFARINKLPILARILDYHESINACLAAGLTNDELIFGRGPFSTKINADLIRKYDIRSLVTKDSGQAGGLETKVEAAKQENCEVVVVTCKNQNGRGFSKFHQLAIAAKNICSEQLPQNRQTPRI
jgi:precorrin-6A/cobalt-precorrin-6A reductase